VREVHSDHVETRCSLLALCSLYIDWTSHTFPQHGNLLSTVGLWTCILLGLLIPPQCSVLTDCADDARSAVVSFGSIVNIEARVPLHLGSVVEVVQSVAHGKLSLLDFAFLL